jgi:hypothetical protein
MSDKDTNRFISDKKAAERGDKSDLDKITAASWSGKIRALQAMDSMVAAGLGANYKRQLGKLKNTGEKMAEVVAALERQCPTQETAETAETAEASRGGGKRRTKKRRTKKRRTKKYKKKRTKKSRSKRRTRRR